MDRFCEHWIAQTRLELVPAVPEPDPGKRGNSHVGGQPRRPGAGLLGWAPASPSAWGCRNSKTYVLLAVALSGAPRVQPTATAHGTTSSTVGLCPALADTDVLLRRYWKIHCRRHREVQSWIRSTGDTVCRLPPRLAHRRRDQGSNTHRGAAPRPSTVIIIEQTANVTPETGELGTRTRRPARCDPIRP